MTDREAETPTEFFPAAQPFLPFSAAEGVPFTAAANSASHFGKDFGCRNHSRPRTTKACPSKRANKVFVRAQQNALQPKENRPSRERRTVPASTPGSGRRGDRALELTRMPGRCSKAGVPAGARSSSIPYGRLGGRRAPIQFAAGGSVPSPRNPPQGKPDPKNAGPSPHYKAVTAIR